MELTHQGLLQYKKTCKCLLGSVQRVLLEEHTPLYMLFACAAVGWSRTGLTHAVFHHHEATLITFKALAFKVSRCVDALALSTKVRRDAALVDV